MAGAEGIGTGTTEFIPLYVPMIKQQLQSIEPALQPGQVHKNDLFGRTRAAWTLSLILMSILFGFGHFDQGAIGQIENVIGGCLLGLFESVHVQTSGHPGVHGTSNGSPLPLSPLPAGRDGCTRPPSQLCLWM